MRISCLLLAAYAALAVAAPAQQRAGPQLVARASVDADGDTNMDSDGDVIMGSGDESYHYSTSDDGYVTPEPPSDSEDEDYNPNRNTNTADSQYRLGFWRVYGTGDDGVTMRAENTYPSYSTDFVKDVRNDNIPHYDYSAKIDDWSLTPLSRANALKTGRVLSAYIQFPSKKPTEAEIDTKIIIGKCPGTQDLNRVKTDTTPIRLGLSSGLPLVFGQEKTASFYHTEHVYEKQIISEFFKSVFTTAAGAKWFKMVAENDLHLYNSVDPKALYTLDAKLWSATPAPAGWKSYKALGKTLAAVVKDIEPKSHGSLATALGAVVGSDFRRDHLTALEAELNISKGRIFSKNEVHSQDRLLNLGKKECVKNAALLDKNLEPDADIVFSDRMNLIKQPVVIWKYMLTPEVWNKFASTSSEVYRLLKIFDTTYTALQGQSDAAKAARKERSKAVKEWANTGAGTLPTGKTSLAEAYKTWLPTYLDAVIEKSAAYKQTSIDHMKLFYGKDLKGKFTASHVAMIEKEWTEYSEAKLKAALKGAKIDACFMG